MDVWLVEPSHSRFERLTNQRLTNHRRQSNRAFDLRKHERYLDGRIGTIAVALDLPTDRDQVALDTDRTTRQLTLEASLTTLGVRVPFFLEHNIQVFRSFARRLPRNLQFNFARNRIEIPNDRPFEPLAWTDDGSFELDLERHVTGFTSELATE